MDIRITPSVLGGTFTAPASKSYAHRMFICAALSTAPTIIGIDSIGEDILATIDCIQALGAKVTLLQRELVIEPIREVRSNPILNCRNSGATLRFLLPVVAALGCNAVFIMGEQLANRPIAPLLKAISARGCDSKCDKLSITLDGKLSSGSVFIQGDVSSQFISGLLFAGAAADKGLRIFLTTPAQSASYINLTISMLEKWGVTVIKNYNSWRVLPNQALTPPKNLNIEGDWSGSAFWLAAATLSKQEITGKNLPIKTQQGDNAILTMLKNAGASVTTSGDSVTVSPSVCKGISVDVSDSPDLSAPLAAAAISWDGVTNITNAHRLRGKESDRLHVICESLGELGANLRESHDSITITGTPRLKGGVEVNGYEDHRIVMALAIAASRCENPVIIRGAEAVGKSYPQFLDDFKRLGGIYDVI